LSSVKVDSKDAETLATENTKKKKKLRSGLSAISTTAKIPRVLKKVGAAVADSMWRNPTP